MPAYFDQKRRTWYAKFRYTDFTGASRYATKRGFPTKKAALEYEAATKRTARDMPDMTIKELSERYLSVQEGRLKSSTLEDREGDIRNYILPVLGSVRLSDLTPHRISEWQQWLLTQPPRIRNPKQKCAPAESGVIAPSTANAKNRALVIMLNFAVRMGWLAKNPATVIPRVGHRVARLEFWEKEQYDAFIGAGRGDDDYDTFRLEFDLLFYGGFRLAELRGLGANDFNFDRNEIRVDHAMDERGRKIGLKTKASYRTVSMPPSLMSRVREYIGRLYDPPAVGIFPYSARMLRKQMQLWAARAGLPYIMLHGLRHSHASYLISMNIPITAISKRLGHESPKVTLDIYAHLYEKDRSNISEILEAALNPVK